jgi:hypothetical protein
MALLRLSPLKALRLNRLRRISSRRAAKPRRPIADKDRQIVAAFKRRGFSVTLMDRNDPKLPYDVRPYKGWLDVGRVVRKGQRGVRGLFHLTQTDALPSATPPKGKKAKLHAVKS